MTKRARTDTASTARFALTGLASIALLGSLILFAVSRISTSEALRSAEERARLAAYGIVEPALNSSLADDRAAISSADYDALDGLIQTRVLSERVVRVKLWSPDARVVYSDERALVGAKFAPKADHISVLKSGDTEAEVANTSSPENRFERSSGQLLEVYLPIRLPDGRQLVYEQYERYDSVTGNSQRLLGQLALPLGAGLFVLWLTQFPLARSLARRIREADNQRASLLEHAITASQRERARIATDLHDGVVQDLAGLTFELSAAGHAAPTGATKDALERSADVSRNAMRRLRSALVDLQPTNVHALGLADSLQAVCEPLRRDGIDVTMDLTPEVERLSTEEVIVLYRCANELLRNVHEHSGATTASVQVAVHNNTKAAQLKVIDNGHGYDDSTLNRKRAEGHMGLELHEAMLRQAGGTLTISSIPGKGTTAIADLPLSAGVGS